MTPIQILSLVFFIPSILSLVTIVYLLFREKLKKRTSIIALSILSILLVASFFVLSFVNQDVVKKEVKKEVEKEIVNPDKVDFNKAMVVLTVSDMLKEFNKNPTGELLSPEDRVNKLQKKNLLTNKVDLSDIVTEKSLDYLYLIDSLDYDIGRAYTTEAILAIIHSIYEFGGNLEPVVSMEDIDSIVYLDPYHQTAFVPVAVFTGFPVFLDFEMVYTNDGWKFVPYTFIQLAGLSGKIIEFEQR